MKFLLTPSKQHVMIILDRNEIRHGGVYKDSMGFYIRTTGVEPFEQGLFEVVIPKPIDTIPF